MRNLLEAHLPPGDATRRNPFREWIGARLRVDAYGWAAGGDPVRAARMAWEDARLSHTANGVYAAMFMAAAHAASLGASRRRPRAPTPASRSCPRDSRLAEALARRARARGSRVGGRRRRAVRALRRLPLGARDQQHRARRRGALRVRRRLLRRDLRRRQGGWDTDTNGAAVGSILGALAADRRALVGAARGRFASSLPGFDGDRRLDASSPPRTRRGRMLRSRRRATRSSRGRSTCRRVPLDPAPTRRARRGEDPRRARRPGRLARLARARSRAGATRRARGSATTAAPTTPRSRGRRAASRSRWSGSGTSCSTTTTPARFTPDRFCAEAEREFGGFDGIVLWHAYPVIGIDERNQFDWYRDVPGLRELVADLPGARRPRVRRLQPVGHRHAARAGRRRRGARASSCASSAPTASSSTR